MSETKTVGRKAKYEQADLEAAIEKFAINHVGEEITIPKLVKFTGIPRHIWRYSEPAKELTNRLNERNITVDSSHSDLFTLPNVSELVNANYGNKNKLIKALSKYTEYINVLYNDAQAYQLEKEKNETLLTEIDDLKLQLKKAKDDTNFYKDEMKRMALDSTSLKKRKEQNIKENVIQITNRNKDIAGATASNMNDVMSSLFGK